MYTLLLDSSNIKLNVGLAKDNVLLDFVSYEAWQTQSEFMIPEIDKLLNKYNVQRKEIESVAVCNGPGSYTGVRIAITIGKTMAAVLPIKLFAISSLQVLKKFDEPSICLINARSGRSYFGVYQGNSLLETERILTNEEVIKYINEHPQYVVCGDTHYLNLESYKSNVLEQMILIKKEANPLENPLSLKPIYMKEY